MTASDPEDPVAMLHAGLSGSREHFNTLEQLRAQYAKSPRDKMLASAIDALIEAAVQREDISLPAGLSNRARGSGLVIIGPTGVGKSRALERYFKKKPYLSSYSDPAAPSPLLSVSAPSPCTSMALARAILHASGYPIVRDLTAHRLWELVWERMDLIKRFLLHIDELQHVVQHISDKERQEVANLLKHAMYGRRISLIISGVDTLAPFLEFDDQLFRRFTIKRFPQLDADTIQDLVRAVHDYTREAGLGFESGDAPERPDFFARLAHAGLNAFGYAIVVLHLAIENALRTGATVLTREHFATVFAEKTNFSADRNVFVAEKWHEIDCTKLFPKTEIPPPPAAATRKVRK